MQKKSLFGVFAASIVSVMLMVDVPVKANDPMMKESMKGHGSAPAMMSHTELRNAMRMLWEEHLAYTTTEVVSRLKKDWAADIQAYDQGHAHMMMFADALSDGILKQMPKKFRK